ncbi:MAG: threonine ammonia-lyase [Thermoplasmata archaeon]|nr:threonine ammonia-lyase [Thermoplasmata archaeon]
MTETGSTLSVQLADVREAAERLRGIALRTPLIPAPHFPGLPESGLYLKLECFQRTGSFKLRGAANRISHLTEAESKVGVITASAGNHSQGVAWAARARGLPATIVMAETASPLKVSATRALGARVILFGADYDEAHDEAVRRAKEEGLTYIPPFDDSAVIAGQGTVGLEIAEDLPGVRRVIAGVGGGGLLSGIAVAIRGLCGPGVEIVGVQPEGSDTFRASLREGRVVVGSRPKTFADGLATRHVGDLNLQILRALGARAAVVDDRTIARASFLLLEHAKLLVEGAGATPLAALLADPKLADDGPTVLVISGGNLDPFLLDRVLWIGLTAEGRLLRIRAPLKDAPGRLAEFLATAGSAAANVRHVVHDRETSSGNPGEVEVELELEVRDRAHADEVLKTYLAKGWAVRRIDELSPAE